MSQYHTTAEEEAMIIQHWKPSWDSEVLGPKAVKSQLKSVLFLQQHLVSLETFLQNLLKTLNNRMIRFQETIHLGETYDSREYTSASKEKKGSK